MYNALDLTAVAGIVEITRVLLENKDKKVDVNHRSTRSGKPAESRCEKDQSGYEQLQTRWFPPKVVFVKKSPPQWCQVHKPRESSRVITRNSPASITITCLTNSEMQCGIAMLIPRGNVNSGTNIVQSPTLEDNIKRLRHLVK